MEIGIININKYSLEKIPESKYILHIRLCSLNVKRCEICNEIITIVDEQKHIIEKHSKKQCKYCNKKYKPELIEEHKKHCSSKLVECQFCELKLRYEDLKEHEYICGSKTQKCPHCGKYIVLKDFNEHISEGCFDLILHDENEEIIIRSKYNIIEEPKDEKEIKEEEIKRLNNENNNNNISHHYQIHRNNSALNYNHNQELSYNINDRAIEQQVNEERNLYNNNNYYNENIRSSNISNDNLRNLNKNKNTLNKGYKTNNYDNIYDNIKCFNLKEEKKMNFQKEIFELYDYIKKREDEFRNKNKHLKNDYHEFTNDNKDKNHIKYNHKQYYKKNNKKNFIDKYSNYYNELYFDYSNNDEILENRFDNKKHKRASSNNYNRNRPFLTNNNVPIKYTYNKNQNDYNYNYNNNNNNDYKQKYNIQIPERDIALRIKYKKYYLNSKKYNNYQIYNSHSNNKYQ